LQISQLGWDGLKAQHFFDDGFTLHGSQEGNLGFKLQQVSPPGLTLHGSHVGY
jgi:hypothetical protein